MKKECKYEFRLHVSKTSEYLGVIKANSIKEAKEKARSHARSWNKNLYGRLVLENERFCDDRCLNVNP